MKKTDRKKLTIRKQSLRKLTEPSLSKAEGARFNPRHWSTDSITKCEGHNAQSCYCA